MAQKAPGKEEGRGRKEEEEDTRGRVEEDGGREGEGRKRGAGDRRWGQEKGEKEGVGGQG